MSNKVKQKNRKRSVAIRAFLVAFLVAVICFDYFNIGYLENSPFEREVKWEEPNAVISNSDGYTAVLDSIGTRATVVSPDNEVMSSIQHNSYAGATPQYTDRICMNKEKIYLLDHSSSKKNKGKSFDRILIYELGGDYLGTAYSTENAKETQIMNIATEDGELYAVTNNKNKKKITVGKITSSGFEKIHTCKYKKNEVFNAYYNPENNIIDILTETGDIISWSDNGEKEISFSGTDVLLSDIVRDSTGRLYGVDYNHHAIVRISEEGNVKKLAKSQTLRLSENDGELLYSNLKDNSVCIYNMAVKHCRKITHTMFSAHEYLMCCITWIVTILGVMALMLLIVLIVISIVRRIKASKAKESDPITKKGIITNGRLYGPAMGITAAVFIISSIMLGSLYYDKVVSVSRDSIEKSSNVISELSTEGFGDKIEQIKKQSDCDSKEYRSVVKTVETFCMKNSDSVNETNKECKLFAFDDKSDNLIVIYDSFGMQRAGMRITEQDYEKMSIADSLEDTKKDKPEEGYIVYENDTRYYQSTAPVKNSEGEIIGISEILMNDTQLCKNTLTEVIMKVIQLFTLLFGLVLMLIEFRVAQMFYKIKRTNAKNGEADRIIPESFRTLDVVFRIPEKLFVIFLTIIATEFVNTATMQLTILLVALPFTLESLSYFIFRVFMGNVVKYNPRKYAFISGACNVIVTRRINIPAYCSLAAI